MVWFGAAFFHGKTEGYSTLVMRWCSFFGETRHPQTRIAFCRLREVGSKVGVIAVGSSSADVVGFPLWRAIPSSCLLTGGSKICSALRFGLWMDGVKCLGYILVITLVELFAVDHMRPATSEDRIQRPDTETKGWDSTVPKVETRCLLVRVSYLLMTEASR